MRKFVLVAVFFAILLVPTSAFSQTTDRITILDNLGTYHKGQSMFVFGSIATVSSDLFLIIQIINPAGNLCKIQQITPLANGIFLTDPIKLSGNICGQAGEYDVKLFYGDYRKNSSFSVDEQTVTPVSDVALFENASLLITAKIQSMVEDSELNLGTYTNRLNSIDNLSDLKTLYVDLWDQFLIADAIYDVSPLFRPAASNAIDSVAKLLESGEITFPISKELDRNIYSAIFNYEIGNIDQAVLEINDVFVELKNVDPIKVTKAPQSFSNLEDTLLNLMTKTDTILNGEVKEELAFILARGTAPIIADKLPELVELLTEARYLEVISRKDTSLYNIVNNQWFSIADGLLEVNTIDKLLERKPVVDDLHAAALLLRQLDNVDRFISDDENVENTALALILKPEWDKLLLKLESASSVQDILNSKTEIRNMKDVIDISVRISKSVEIAQDTRSTPAYVTQWESLLSDVKNATSIEDILLIVSAFDSSITELREKRDPLVTLKFQYEQLKQKAELQADHINLHLINQALRAIDIAEKSEIGNPSVYKTDRTEVLLTWASQTAPIIRAELETEAEDLSESRISDILQRAQSIENLVETSLRKSKFLPGYIDFTNSMLERLDVVRSLVIQKELFAADDMVRDLFSEWRTVTDAYAKDPTGSPNGYSLDEIQRIKYKKQLDLYTSFVTTFHNADFNTQTTQYQRLVDDARDLIDFGNFVDFEIKIKEIGAFIKQHLPLKNSGIMFDIDYNQERNIWTLSGAVSKQVQDRRENLYVTVYDTNGDKHSRLEFTDTRDGDFYTQWNAPTTPGLYVVLLQYQNIQASQIIHVVDKTVREPTNPGELDAISLARDFKELQDFMRRFGGVNYDSNPTFSVIVAEIKANLASRNNDIVDSKLDNLNSLIERYLPTRSRSAVIEAQFDSGTLLLSGAVQKSLEFREDLYVDIYNQQGTLVQSIALKDNAAGFFNESILLTSTQGIHVAQLQYHDLIVTDFFTIK